MMNNSKAKSQFSSFKKDYAKHLGPDGLEKAKPYIMFLLKFIDGARLIEVLKTLKRNKGDIKATQQYMKGLYKSKKPSKQQPERKGTYANSDHDMNLDHIAGNLE